MRIEDNDSKRADNPDFNSGLQNHFKIKRSDKVCPRCSYKTHRFTVDKDHRKCTYCCGRLYWDGDDFQHSLDTYEDFYVWHKSIFGLEGWFHKSYFFGVPKPITK